MLGKLRIEISRKQDKNEFRSDIHKKKE